MSHELKSLFQKEMQRAEEEYRQDLYVVPRAFVEFQWENPQSELDRLHGLTFNFCPLSLENEVPSAIITLAAQIKPLGRVLRCVISSFVASDDAWPDRIRIVAIEKGAPTLCGTFDIAPVAALVNWRLVDDSEEAKAFADILDARVPTTAAP